MNKFLSKIFEQELSDKTNDSFVIKIDIPKSESFPSLWKRPSEKIALKVHNEKVKSAENKIRNLSVKIRTTVPGYLTDYNLNTTISYFVKGGAATITLEVRANNSEVKEKIKSFVKTII